MTFLGPQFGKAPNVSGKRSRALGVSLLGSFCILIWMDIEFALKLNLKKEQLKKNHKRYSGYQTLSDVTHEPSEAFNVEIFFL